MTSETPSSTPTAPTTPASMMSQRFYDAAYAVTEKYSKAMRKHLFIIIGVMMYIAFVVMATVYYAPSYYACLAKNGTMWSIANSMVHAIFIVFLLFYVFRSFLVSTKDGGFVYPEGVNGEIRDFAEAFSKLVPYGLGVCILFLVVSYGILFFSCRNPITCEGCSPSKQTAFTDLVTKQVNRITPTIEQLYKFYEENMGARVPIAACSNFYNGSYQNAVAGEPNATCEPYDPENAPTCRRGPVTRPTDSNKTFGATADDAGPTLGQFYVMSSSRTCVVGNQYDGYMSAAMIRVALKAGARCLDFDLCNYGHGKSAFPIVTVPRDRDNYNMQHNFVRFEDALKTIVDEWIQNWPHGVPRDPLFLHLTLRRGLTRDCMNQIAYLLQYYLNEQQTPGYLLPPKYHYQQLQTFPHTLGHVNLCTLFNKIVILVHAPTHAPTPLLDGLINGLAGKSMHRDVYTDKPSYGFQEMEWKEMMDIPKERLVERSRYSLVYVDTSFHPYSPVSEKLRDGEGGLSNDLNAEYSNSDTFSTLIMYKQTINNDPTPSFYRGCQFMAMNFQNLDVDMKLYLSVFKRSSFVLKPKAMWPKLDMEDLPQPQTICDPTDHVAMRTTAGGDPNTPDKCYTVCVPKPLYDNQPDVYTTMGYTRIERPEQTCTTLMTEAHPVNGYNTMFPSQEQIEDVENAELRKDLGIPDTDVPEVLAQRLVPTKNGEAMRIAIEQLTANTGDRSRGETPSK